MASIIIIVKISFITTVLNEEDSLSKLLTAINNQTIRPDEVIIVDGGSKDNTIEVAIEFQKSKENKLKIKLIKSSGNRSKGRNIAIDNASGEIIVCTDSGCIPHKDWIKNLAKGFSKDVDVVSGYYKPVPKTVFEKCLSTYTSVMPDRVSPKTFLPSSRSIAFKKSAWHAVGGYPEWLDTCEDLYFAKQLKRKGLKFLLAKNAIVYWPQRKNLAEAINQFFSYALGDGMARYIRPSTPFLYIRYLIGIVLLILYFKTGSLFLLALIWALILNYILWAIMKNYYYINDKRAIFWLSVLQFSADIAVISGTTIGLIRSFQKKHN
jgi:glycosyltransferase involved in cell wall biosynthesis